MINSVYIHVPFCRKKCLYCDFYSEPIKPFKEYKELLLKEVKIRNLDLNGAKTLYFGGGTPSLMEADFFREFVALCKNAEEITVEINPEDISKDYIRSLKEVGITRISVGVQSLKKKVLEYIGRNFKDVSLKKLEIVFEFFENVNADLIYGIPEDNVIDSLKELVKLPFTHFSVYLLSPKGKMRLKKEEELEKEYFEMIDFLEENGFSQYEISNFAKENFECKHNTNYWKLKNYAGLGASSASFINAVFLKNPSNLQEYISGIKKGVPSFEERVAFKGIELKKIKLAMGFRLVKEGVNLKKLGVKIKRNIVEHLCEEGFLKIQEDKIFLTRKALLVSNEVIRRCLAGVEEVEEV
jgi:oxygen-independent coproporphyrinogen-3 oxidase